MSSAQPTNGPQLETKSEDSGHSKDGVKKRQIRGFKWFLVVAAVLSSMFIYALDNTITADLVPAISNDFQDVPLLPWLSVGFMAGSTAVVLVLGKLYAKYNAKWLYISFVALFLASSALCGAAPTMSAMIVGRVFLGLAGNGMYAGILNLLTAYTEDQERPGYLSLIGLVWGIGTVLGPVVGGAFERFNWRWSFYINLIIGGIFLPVYLFILPPLDPLKSPKTGFRERIKNFDFLGAILFIGFVITLVMGVNFGGPVYAWNSGSIITLFVMTGVLLIVFAVQQRFAFLTTAVDRVFPAEMLKFKEANLLFICAATCNAAGFIPMFYIPLYFQFSRGDNALDAAVRLLPLIVVLSAAILANGFLMGKLGYYFPWYLLGSVLALTGNVMLYHVHIDTSIAQIYGYEVLVAAGTGVFIQAGYATIQTAVPGELISEAVPFMMLAQFTGITLGLSISGAIFVNTANNALQALLPSLTADDISSILSGTSGHALDKVPEELRQPALEIIVNALDLVYIPAFVAAAVALLVSLLIKKGKAFQSNPVVAIGA